MDYGKIWVIFQRKVYSFTELKFNYASIKQLIKLLHDELKIYIFVY